VVLVINILQQPLSSTDFFILLWGSISNIDRSQKLKDARGEAAKEIESLKSKREEEFKEFEQQVRPTIPPLPLCMSHLLLPILFDMDCVSHFEALWEHGLSTESSGGRDQAKSTSCHSAPFD
jgi:hypothetical protein